MHNEPLTNTQNTVKPQRNMKRNVIGSGHMFCTIWSQAAKSFTVVELGIV
jgi:hypothetical protein